MMTNCGCREISHEPIEFKIEDCRPQVYASCGPLLPNSNEIDWCKLQNKVICGFKKVIKLLECGIQPDIEIILEEISLIFMNTCGYNVAKKMYSTDIEEDYFLKHNNFLSEFETQEEKDLVLLNLGIYDKINGMITKQDLDTKIGFVVKVGKFYYGFASETHYGLWLKNGDERLILGKWLSPDYIPIQYTITFDNTGGDPNNPIGNPVNDIEVYEGVYFIFPTPTYSSDTPKNFMGWYSEYDPITKLYGGDRYDAGERLVPAFNMIFYAKWVSEPRTITFYPNDETDTLPTVINCYKGDQIKLVNNGVNIGSNIELVEITNNNYRIGYHLKSGHEWNTQLDGSGTNYMINHPDWITVDDNLVLYALWEKNKYTITFDFNYPNDPNAPSNITRTVNYGTLIDENFFPQSDYTTSDGKIIKGWNVYRDGTGQNYLSIAGDIIPLSGNNIIFYAQWEYGYKYMLATTVPSEPPIWNYANTRQIKLKNLIGWNDWMGQSNQYIMVPAVSGKTEIDEYVDIWDLFNLSILIGLRIVESSLPNTIVMKWFGFSLLNKYDENASLIFK